MECNEDTILPEILKACIEVSGHAKIIFQESGETSGRLPCPVEGCEGTVHWSIAWCNQHVRAQCSEPGCVNFIE